MNQRAKATYVACGGRSSPVKIVERGPGSIREHYRPEYTKEEARQVADWMNGVDQPLPSINMSDPWRGERGLGVDYPS